MKIISVVGKKDTGKTSLTVKIIEELRKRDLKVASIKHSHHMLEMDRENTDTWKHKEAGSETVVGIGSRTFFNIAKDLPLERILFLIKIIDEPDFVVIEGFKNYSYPKISTSKEIVDDFTLRNIDALNIKDEEIPELVDFIEKHSYDIIDTLYTNNCGLNNGEAIGKAIINQENLDIDDLDDIDVHLSINEKVIGLNSFVNIFMKNSIIGMLKSLKTEEYGIKDLEKIEIVINNGNKE
ncbi:molybdopterin-guanine dinucleotide biosynthesis protein B [Methanobrevibacter sp. TMH8]|nr:molybdopterin-guanine dinucleotide biosynthesis protein B [Methanobrevibacter sp. TMH8]